jgi:ComEC/Rec2-related protein
LWEFLNTHFTGPAPGLILALMSGDKQFLDPQLKTQLNHAGLAHLMAVSGYHVGLISFPFLALLRHHRSGYRFAGFIGLTVTWCFIAFCGFPTSAVRAGLMLTGYGLSQLARLNLSPMHLMSTAAWAMLIYNPQWAVDLGMQLSFVAVYAILLSLELLKAGRFQHPFLIYIIVPIAAQLGTGFIAWPTFGLFPKYFLFFNLLASPLMVVLGVALASIIGMEFILDWEHGVNVASHGVDAALNHVLNELAIWHSSAWTWDLRVVDEGLLIALSATALVGGTLAVARKIALRQFIRSCCAIGLGLIPWIMWQSHHRASVSYRHGIVLDAGASCNTSVTTNPRDSARLISERAKFGGTHNRPIALSPKPTDFNSSDTWVVAPSKHAGFGQLKSRPFAWKRMNGSTVLFSYGADTVHLKKWEQPSVVE